MRRHPLFELLTLALLGVVACSTNAKSDPEWVGAAPIASQDPSTSESEINPRLLRRFKPLPSSVEIADRPPTSAQVDLGRMLYFDVRLSRGNDVSCNSCHDLSTYGADSRSTSIGAGGKHGKRNAPTVYNAAGHFAQFWDGRAADVEAQAKGPILNPTEMAMPDEQSVVKRLAAIAGYRKAFAAAFPGSADAVTYDNVGRAIGAFERGLLTPSRWDRYLGGDKNALTVAEREGLKGFLDAGCMSCHTGAFVGGSMFERVGVVEPWPNQTDEGRSAITKAPADRMVFKVPSLRNVARTSPYFHDGSAASLEEAVKRMGRHQLGLDLSDTEIASIVAWLGSLTGELPPPAYIARPELPQ